MPIATDSMDRRREYVRFLLAFLFLGFVMKAAGEFIHELGHASLVLFFGGRVTGMSISVEWPFVLSHTRWELQDPTGAQIAYISVAGIVLDVATSLAGQTFLQRKKGIHILTAVAVFWLSFWTYLSSVVYLVVGAIYPFGDILSLIDAVPISPLLIGVIGVVLLTSFTYSLSLILRELLSSSLGLRNPSEMVSYFWAILHLFFVSITILTYGLPLSPVIAMAVMATIFVWSFFAAGWLMAIVSRLRGTEVKSKLTFSYKGESPDLEAEDDARRRNRRLGYGVLFTAALASVILTGYMLNQYTATYSLVMRTGIEVNVTGFELVQGEPTLNLSVTVVNPNREELRLRKIEFDVHLNQGYMDHHALTQIPVAQPMSEASFEHVLVLPEERMFTIDEAQAEGRWEWRITGSGYVETLFGDTLLRFRSSSTAPPR